MDEDIEFRDMVLKKLDENGSLLDVKAKIRAYLYDVIENEGKFAEAVNDSDLTYNGDKSELDEDEPEEELDNHALALGLVHDLLDCLKLSYTKRVLLAEAGVKKPCSRERLQREVLGKPSTIEAQEEEEDEHSEVPKEAVLYQLLDRSRKASSSQSGAGSSEVSQVSREISEHVTDESAAT